MPVYDPGAVITVAGLCESWAMPSNEKSASTCPNCGTENPTSARFCMGCGLSLGTLCPVCSIEIPDEARFCPSCGARVLDDEQIAQARSGAGRAPATERRGSGDRPAGSSAPSRRASDPGPVKVGQIAATGVIQPGEERRVVTILFGDLSGFTALSEQHDAEEIKQTLDATFRALGAVIEEHGGTVDKFIGDNIMATFGAPTAHEDDPERAVRAALAMRELLADRNAKLEAEHGFTFEMRIGINSGEVMAGRLGADRADAYTVMGDAVNVASRLEQAAKPGQVLVGPETKNLCSDRISFSRGRRLSVKGKAEAIEAFEALEAIGSPAPGGRERELGAERESPFVGRLDELAAIASTARAARDLNRAHFVTVLGEPGVGKTRLLEEAALTLDHEGFVFLWGRTAPYGGAPPLTPAIDMIRAACDVTDDDDLETARTKITERVTDLVETDQPGSSGGLVRRLLDAIGLGEDGGGHAGIREATGPIDRFFEALAREGPVVLVFDDLHWADDELAQMVESVPNRLRDVPIVLIAVARPVLLEARPEWGGGKRHAFTMQLEALSAQEAEDFVAATLGDRALDRSTLDLIIHRAGGNPLFLAELMLFLENEGILVESRGEWEVAEPERLEALPNNLRSLIAARLDGLPVDDKELLQLASVVGETFWTGALSSITGLEEGEMAEPLERLVEADLLIPSGRPALSGEQEYRFRHGLTREAAYRTLPRSRRARLHTLAGTWLEGREGEGAADGEADLATLDFQMLVLPAGGLLEEIAYHYEQAALLTDGDEERAARERAFKFLASAARQAVERSLFLQAERLYQRAHEMASPTTGSLEGLGAALFGLGRADEAEILLEDALDRSVAEGDRAAQARILTRMSEMRQRQGRIDDAVDLADAALNIWREFGDHAGETDTLLARGRIYVRTGRNADAFNDFATARENARTLGNVRQEAWALQSMAWCRFNSGMFDGARELVEESLLHFSTMTEVEGIGSSVVLLGWIDTFDGRLIEPRETAEGLRKLAHESGEYWGEGLCATLECLTSVGLGEALRGRREALEALEILSAVEDRWAQAVAGTYLGYAESKLGRPREAVAAFRDALAHARVAGDPMIEGSILYFWAWHLLHEDDVEGAAARAAEAAIVMAEIATAGPWSREPMRLMAAIAHKAGFDETARDLLEITSSEGSEEGEAHALGRRTGFADLALLQVDLGEAERALTSCEEAENLYSEDHESAVKIAVAKGRALEQLGHEGDAGRELASAWSTSMAGEDAWLVMLAGDSLAAFREATGDEAGADSIREEAALYVDELAAVHER